MASNDGKDGKGAIKNQEEIKKIHNVIRFKQKN
jgi:hypothetical protein